MNDIPVPEYQNEETPPPDSAQFVEKELKPPQIIGIKPSFLILLTLFLFAAGLGTGYLLWNQNLMTPVKGSLASNLARILPDDDPSLGLNDAPITIVAFSDYECPYCRKWYKEVWPALQAAYPDQIRLVYRDFPLGQMHPNAVQASLAANCALEQDRFWEYHDLLLGSDASLSVETLQDYAGQASLDTTAFVACMSNESMLEEIRADFEDGVNLGITGTPTFFIGGYRLVGAQPVESFQQVIQSQLEKTKH